MRMNTSPNVLAPTTEIHRDRHFFNQIALYHGVKQGDNSEIQNFRNERRHGAGNLKKDLFLGHIQPPIDKFKTSGDFDFRI